MISWSSRDSGSTGTSAGEGNTGEAGVGTRPGAGGRNGERERGSEVRVERSARTRLIHLRVPLPRDWTANSSFFLC
jgi:hypothetical protein